MHEGVQFPGRYCTETTANGSLAKHHKEGHEGVKHPCKHCSYKGTWKGNLREHQKSVH